MRTRPGEQVLGLEDILKVILPRDKDLEPHPTDLHYYNPPLAAFYSRLIAFFPETKITSRMEEYQGKMHLSYDIVLQCPDAQVRWGVFRSRIVFHVWPTIIENRVMRKYEQPLSNENFQEMVDFVDKYLLTA